MRKTSEELNELCAQFGVDRLWSWSRVNCVHNSLYEYFLKYIKCVSPDRDNSIYTVTGGICHDIIEKFYKNEIAYEQMIDEFNDGWMTAYEIGELKFDRSDTEKNQNIANKYYKDLIHFFKNHKKLPYKVQLEQFVTIKLDDEYYQGYIDCCYKDNDDNYIILDWKTSSIYKGDKALNECGQLVLYAIALHQKGVPYDKIRIAWDFLKYQCVTVESKKGDKKVREIERAELGTSLKANAKMWLNHFKYTDEQVDEYLVTLEESNDITVLPEEVQAKYEFNDCIVYVDLTDELINKWETHIIETTKDIREKEAEYNKTFDEKIWWEDEEAVKKQSYYFSNLCSYSPNLHKPYGSYLDKFNLLKNIIAAKKQKVEDDEDMSWLDNL